MNKKGAVLLYIFMGLITISVLYLVFGGLVQQAVIGPEEVEEELVERIEITAEAISKGDQSIIYAFTYDETADSETKVATVLYGWRKESPEIKLKGADATAVSITSKNAIYATIGDEVTFRAFNTSWYSVPEEVKVIQEVQDVKIGVMKIATDLKVNFYDDGAKLALDNQNWSLGASQADAWDKTVIELNITNRAHRLKWFAFDTVVGSNVTDLDMTGPVKFLKRSSDNKDLLSRVGMLTETANVVSSDLSIERIKDYDDFIFELDKTIVLLEWDQIELPGLTLEADADGCVGIGSDVITLRIVDDACMVSAESATRGEIICGVAEDDSTSNTDVGGSDITPYGIYCN